MLLLVAAWWWVIAYHDRPTSVAGSLLGPLLAGTVAALSLMCSLGTARRASKDQYTLTLVGARLESSDYQENARIVSEWTRAQRITSDTTLDELKLLAPPLRAQTVSYDEKDKPPFYALVMMLNHWEHICTAYVDDRINRQIFEDTVQDLVRELTARHRTIIGGMRGEDGTNLEHLCAVWFVLASDDERQAHTGRLGPAPLRLCPDDRYRWVRLG